MRLSILVAGILVILGAVAEHALTPQIFKSMNNSITKLDSSFSPILTSAQTTGYSFSSLASDYKLGQLESGVQLIAKISDLAAYGSAIVGVCIVAYGIFSKNTKSMIVYQNKSEALEILKKRLAQGEITKEEFKKLRNDVT